MQSDFHGRHFKGEFILLAVRWYCKYSISYRELQEILEERGVPVSHTTIYRWVQQYAPEIERRLRRYWQKSANRWHIDETYIKVRNRWGYLYRAVTPDGKTIDFYLSRTRNAKAAELFLAKAMRRFKDYERPVVLNTDKAACYVTATRKLRKNGLCSPNTQHHQIKYRNNIIESDHGKPLVAHQAYYQDHGRI